MAPDPEPHFARGPGTHPSSLPPPAPGPQRPRLGPPETRRPTGSDVSHCLATVAKELVSRNPLEPGDVLGVGDSGFLKKI